MEHQKVWEQGVTGSAACVRNVTGVAERVEKASLEAGSSGHPCFMHGELHGAVIYPVAPPIH